LYVVDSEEHLIGVVELHELLRAPETVTLAALMHKPPAVLTSATSLAGAANQRGWERASVLPVVDRAGRLIGVMRRGVLSRALARHRIAGHAATDVSLPGLLARGYWDAVSGLAAALLSLLPKAGAVWREKQ
jgi:predicted transcriptional regulator